MYHNTTTIRSVGESLSTAERTLLRTSERNSSAKLSAEARNVARIPAASGTRRRVRRL